MIPVSCPTCGETFEVPEPHPSELPCAVDYDCEVCCRPMVIEFEDWDGETSAQAHGLGE